MSMTSRSWHMLFESSSPTALGSMCTSAIYLVGVKDDVSLQSLLLCVVSGNLVVVVVVRTMLWLQLMMMRAMRPPKTTAWRLCMRPRMNQSLAMMDHPMTTTTPMMRRWMLCFKSLVATKTLKLLRPWPRSSRTRPRRRSSVPLQLLPMDPAPRAFLSVLKVKCLLRQRLVRTGATP